MKLVVVIALLMQSFAFSGPVCGNHATTGESMACCAKGHNDGATGLHDSHAGKCCASCDMGKASAIKRQDSAQIAATQILSILAIPEMRNAVVPQAFFDSKHEYPPGLPEILLLKQTLRI